MSDFTFPVDIDPTVVAQLVVDHLAAGHGRIDVQFTSGYKAAIIVLHAENEDDGVIFVRVSDWKHNEYDSRWVDSSLELYGWVVKQVSNHQRRLLDE